MQKQDLIAELEIRLKMARAGGADVIKFSPKDVADVLEVLREGDDALPLSNPGDVA